MEHAVTDLVEPDAVPITVNGREFAARAGELVIAAVERAGEYIPRFCYHPRMTSVGMCRMCLVEIDTGRGPGLQPSCMITVAPDMKVDTESATTKRAQQGILELLLANHPLDCPVCDKGGECPLQDQAFTHGPGESRYVEEKRHYEKPIPISDLVLLDRERCVLCDRCTRFADEVAGDPLIHFIQRGNEMQVMTFPDQPFTSYFSGNTVQICPVGALTARPYRFKSRPWDLGESASTCTTCAVGCRMTVQSSRDQLVRYLGVDSDPVNWGWLCDKGRFGFEAVNSSARVATPLVRGEATSWNAAMSAVTEAIRTTLATKGPSAIALLGGARGTNEDAYAWARLADALDVDRDAQLGDGLPAALLDLPRATIDDAASAPTVVLLGPDLKEELPVLHLRLRHAATKGTTRLLELSPVATGLSRYAWRSMRIEPGGASAVTAALSSEEVREQLGTGPVVIVAGRANLAESEDAAAASLRAAYDAVAAAQPAVTVLPALRRGNVVGALQLGLRARPEGRDARAILAAAAAGEIDVLVLLGADPVGDCPDGDLGRLGVEGAAVVIALDTFLTDSTVLADVVLPAAAFGEKAGSTTNLEGRVTEVAQRVTPIGTARADWMVAAELADRLGYDDLAAALTGVDAVTDAIAAGVAGYGGATAAALRGNVDGVLAVAPAAAAGVDALGGFAATDRNSYDYRLVVSRTLYDRAVGTVNSPSLAPLAPAAAAYVNPADADKIGAPLGSAVRLVGAKGTVVLPLAASPAVPRGVVLVPFKNTGSDASATSIADVPAGATDVRIEAG
jgi:NADH-quinone oxidoreductase subunit G